jgi:uncharacterized protein (TIGR01777 family)
LAGESIAKGRWTEEQKAAIQDSRVQGTKLLCEALAKLQHPPKVLICASAVGYYGSRGDEILTETSAPGDDFLARVCKNWEKATYPATERGIRVVNLRFGMILSPKGGALKKMLPIFQFGLGGHVGNGQQYMSWIDLEDVIGVIHYAMTHEDLRGPVNTVAPNPVTNQEFTQVVSRVLFRPAILPVPALAVKATFGEMGAALLLSSQRANPVQLEESGYKFQFPTIESALRHQLRKS